MQNYSCIRIQSMRHRGDRYVSCGFTSLITFCSCARLDLFLITSARYKSRRVHKVTVNNSFRLKGNRHYTGVANRSEYGLEIYDGATPLNSSNRLWNIIRGQQIGMSIQNCTPTKIKFYFLPPATIFSMRFPVLRIYMPLAGGTADLTPVKS